MTFEEFATYIADGLFMSHELLVEERFDVLGIDSLQLLEIDLLIEELGVLLSEANLADARSLRDLYENYLTAVVPVD